MVQLSSGGPASSCRSWNGPLQKAYDLIGRRNGRGHISEDKGNLFKKLVVFWVNVVKSY